MITLAFSFLTILFTTVSPNAAAPIAIEDTDSYDTKSWPDLFYGDEYYDDDYLDYFFTSYSQTQFGKSDTDHNGKLSFDEFLKNDIYNSYVQQQQAIFKAMDTDEDGFVTQEEEDVFVQQLDKEIVTWDMRSYDTMFNGNNDSKLQLNEFIRFCQNEYYYIYGDAYKNVSEYFFAATRDKDGDHTWNLDEMAAWMDDDEDWPDDYFEESTLTTNDTDSWYDYWYSLDSPDVLLDAKGDGVITEDEKDAFEEQLKEQEDISLTWDMRQYDKHYGGNNDTLLQVTEFVVYCNGEWPERFGPVAYSNITEYFALFDKNHDHAWNLDEMASWMTDLESWPDSYIEASTLATDDDDGNDEEEDDDDDDVEVVLFEKYELDDVDEFDK